MDNGGVSRDRRYRNRSRLVEKHDVWAFVSFTLLLRYGCNVLLHILEGTEVLFFAFCLLAMLPFCRIWSQQVDSVSGFIPDRLTPSLAAVSFLGVLGWRVLCSFFFSIFF